jgi:hypothetical protein
MVWKSERQWFAARSHCEQKREIVCVMRGERTSTGPLTRKHRVLSWGGGPAGAGFAWCCSRGWGLLIALGLR